MCVCVCVCVCVYTYTLERNIHCESSTHVFGYVAEERRRLFVETAAEDSSRILFMLVQNGMSIKSDEICRLTVGGWHPIRDCLGHTCGEKASCVC
jgi:hypothetical protein